MNDLWLDIRKETVSFKKNTQLLIGIIAIFGGVYSGLTNLLGPRFTILFICLGIFFLVFRICSLVITKDIVSKIEGRTEEYTIPKYPPSYRKAARYLRYFSFVIPLGAWLNFFFYPANSNCHSPEQNIGVIISKFSPDETFDGFSYKMTNLLRDGLLGADSIGIVQEKKFLDISETEYIDTANTIFDGNCFSRGLLIFGYRSDEKLFDCSIYINNLPNIRTSEVRATKNNGEVLYIQNPSLINFSIDNQAQQVAEFVIALLEYNARDFAQVTNRLNKIIQTQNNAGKFASYCYLFVGNSHALANNHEAAITYYEQGLAQDSTNSYLNYNAGVSKLSLGDTLGALTTFKKAAISNSNMKIPNCLESWGTTHRETSTVVIALPQSSETNLQDINTPNLSDSLSSFKFLSPGKYPLWYPVIKRNSNKKYGVTNSTKPYDTIFEFKYDTIKFLQAGRNLYCVMKVNNKYGVGAFYQTYYEVNQTFIDYWYGSILISVEQNSEFDALKKLYDHRRRENAPYVPKSKTYQQPQIYKKP